MLIGMDILEVGRVGNIAQKDSILHRLFTQAELDTIKELGDKRRIINLACIFAAKEAAVKALGTGFTDKIGLKDVQIILTGRGKGRIEFLLKPGIWQSSRESEIYI